MKDLKFKQTKKIRDFSNEGLKILSALKATLYDEIQEGMNEIKDNGFNLMAEKAIKEHRNAYVNVLESVHNYDNISKEVFVAEQYEDNAGKVKTVTEEKLKLLVAYHLSQDFMETILIPLEGNGIQTLTTNLTGLALGNIDKILEGKKVFIPQESKDILENFTKHSYKHVVSKNSEGVLKNSVVPEKLGGAKSKIKYGRINNRLNQLNQEGWKTVESYLQKDEKTNLPFLVSTLFRLKDGAGTILTLTVDNDGFWSSEREKLSLLDKSWLKLIKLWYTKISEKEELVKEFKDKAIKDKKENI